MGPVMRGGRAVAQTDVRLDACDELAQPRPSLPYGISCAALALPFLRIEEGSRLVGQGDGLVESFAVGWCSEALGGTPPANREPFRPLGGQGAPTAATSSGRSEGSSAKMGGNRPRPSVSGTRSRGAAPAEFRQVGRGGRPRRPERVRVERLGDEGTGVLMGWDETDLSKKREKSVGVARIEEVAPA